MTTAKIIHGLMSEASPMGLLDVGCGTGNSISTFSRLRGVKVGIDINKEKIRIAKKTIEKADFIVADAHNLPFRENVFSMLSLSLSLPYLEERVALTEMDRVLRRGGYIFLRLHGLGLYLKLAFGSETRYNHNFLNRAYLLLIIPFTILSWTFRRNLLRNMFQLKSRMLHMLAKKGINAVKI